MMIGHISLMKKRTSIVKFLEKYFLNKILKGEKFNE